MSRVAITHENDVGSSGLTYNLQHFGETVLCALLFLSDYVALSLIRSQLSVPATFVSLMPWRLVCIMY